MSYLESDLEYITSDLDSIDGDDTDDLVISKFDLKEHIETNSRVADPDGYGSEYNFCQVTDQATIRKITYDQSGKTNKGFLVNLRNGIYDTIDLYDDPRIILFKHGNIYMTFEEAKAAVREWIKRPLTCYYYKVDRSVTYLVGEPAY